jgi:dethiobiotin synthetase
MRPVVVTGTDTGVGKTVVTAALACAYHRAGQSVAVVKPVQTGAGPGEHADVADVARLSGVGDLHELVRLPDPLAPDVAARRAGVSLPLVSAIAESIVALAADVVLVEGAGGILVRLDAEGGTIIDLALALPGTAVVVVARAGLGTLNHSALSVEAMRARGVEPVGLVIGSWPDSPDLAAQCNLTDLPAMTGVPLIGMVPESVGGWTGTAFRAAAPTWFSRLP